MNYTQDYDFGTVFKEAFDAIYRANAVTPHTGYTKGPHYWHVELTRSFHLHPVIQRIVYRECVRPVDWQLLLLEWPHVSTEDESKLAYTRNEAHGQDFIANGSARQTRTSIGKYLARHWPHVPDHVRRDWAGTFSPATYEIWDTKEKIIAGVELGPQSCMRSSYGSIPFTRGDNEKLCMYFDGNTDVRVPWDHHPYSVYDPKYGWRMAVRLDVGKPNIVMGRAIVNVSDPDAKYFVRSYRRGETDSDYSHTDEKLEAWLKDQGFAKRHSWRLGEKFRKVQHPREGLMMPYLDGDMKCVSERNDYMVMDDDGRCCDETSGMFNGSEVVGECDCCGATVYEDDGHEYLGRGGDELFCENCCDEYAVDVMHTDSRGRDRSYRGSREDDNVSYCDDISEYIDTENPPSSVRRTEDGEWRDADDTCICENGECHLLDDCVECENGEWNLKEDCVECHDGNWRLEENCWESAEGNWYPDDETQVEVSGGTYHPDELQNLIDNA